MLAIKSRILILVLCFVEIIFLLAAQVFGNAAMILVCLVGFLALLIGSAVNGMAVPVLLFFLPFASIIKLRPGMISFYTIGLIAVYIVYLVLGSRSINVYHLIPGLVLIAISLVVKTLYGYSIDNSYILFSISLLFVPFIMREIDCKYNFYWITIFFSLGIIFASFSAQYLRVFPTITRYVTSMTYVGNVRLSGYYGDPNFYSAHITAALSGILILLLSNPSKKRLLTLITTVILLIYYGLQSVSKSFILVVACLLLFWVVELIFEKGKISAKIMIIATFSVFTVFFLSSTIFSDLIDLLFARFEGNNNWSEFTTGRTVLWVQYINAVIESPQMLLFGKGITKILIGDRNSHNTIIQIFYQLGIVGTGFLIGWISCLAKNLMSGIKIRLNNIPQIFILLLGAFGPWLALDLMFFDEFFLLPIYVCVGIRYLTAGEKQS